jgi:hypothetical protein
MRFQMSINAQPNTVYGPAAATYMIGKTMAIKTGIDGLGDVMGIVMEARVEDGALVIDVDTDEETFKRIPGIGDIPYDYSLDNL